MMSKPEIAKKLTTLVLGIGLTKITKGIVENNTDPDSIVDKVAINAGSFMLGVMLADRARQFTDAKIDAYVEWWNKGRLQIES